MAKKAKLQGKGNILIVDTNPEIREGLARTLTLEGYEVFEAADGRQAFLITETREEPMHLLLTDAVLDGGPNGVDVARHLLVLNRQLKVLYLSMYPEDISIRRQIQSAFTTFLSKPIESGMLLEKVHVLMEKSRSDAELGRAGWKQEAELERQAKLTRMFPQGFTGRIFPHGRGGQAWCRPVNESAV